MHEVVVRAEVAADIRAIDVVNLSAFECDEEAQLVAALRGTPAFIPDLSLVAEWNQRIVGHVLLTKAGFHGDAASGEVLALGPMSVVPSQSHRGVGSTLVQAAIGRARDLRHRAIIVAGQPEYYRRFGFTPIGDWGLSTNLDLPADGITALELVPGALAGGGQVVYPEAFVNVFRHCRQG